MWWGGLRGAVSLALALIVLETPGIDAQTKSFIAVMVTGFVLFTLFVNAPSMRPLIHMLGYDRLSDADIAVRNRALQQSLNRISARIQALAEDNQIEAQLAETVEGEYGARVATVESEVASLATVTKEDWTYIGAIVLVTRERRLYLRGFEDGVIAPKIARNLLAQADNIADAVKLRRIEGYRRAYKRALGFPLDFHIAMFAHRRLGIDGLLGRRLADRIEVLLSTRTVLRRLAERDLPRTGALVGEDAGAALKELLAERAAATQQALEALSLQYPDYSKDLETAFLRRIALRLEDGEYRTMAEEALISQDVFNDLERDMDARRRRLEARPRLDLGLDPAKLVAKVPFLADEEPEMIREIVALLEPIVVVPGERVVRRGEAGDAMYFISSGAVEVGLDPEPVTIGSGDFLRRTRALDRQATHRRCDRA